MLNFANSNFYAIILQLVSDRWYFYDFKLFNACNHCFYCRPCSKYQRIRLWNHLHGHHAADFALQGMQRFNLSDRPLLTSLYRH